MKDYKSFIFENHQWSLLKADSHRAVLRLPVNFQALLKVSIASQQNPFSVIIQILDINHSNVIKSKTPHNLKLQISERALGWQAEPDFLFTKICFNSESKPICQIDPLIVVRQWKQSLIQNPILIT
ncbi:hypothetical protein PanWU01x14_111150 [Parasponia andersonii]|uniref:Uncharacterized protein n=1 Tax=Parasponia andersonii TaxID=3476 RepID=A0A2P5CYW9_PARAD|nr:hypothetical protein PanWU01x14_111150 [Parasponia andersonii]